MAPKRQKALPFSRTVISRAIRSSATSANALPAQNATLALSDGSVSPAPFTPTLTPRSPAPRSPTPPLPTRTRQPRHSWVFCYMPDIDIQTKYYNAITGLEEWRCRYYSTTYIISGSTSGPQRHLEGHHELSRNLARTIQARNI